MYARILPSDDSLRFSLPDESSELLKDNGEEFDFESSLTVFSETKALDLTNKFRKDADAYYVEAKRSTVSSIAQIPYWMYGVLIVLGWNEAMIILFNPLYFTFMLVGLAAACVSTRWMYIIPTKCFWIQVYNHSTWACRPIDLCSEYSRTRGLDSFQLYLSLLFLTRIFFSLSDTTASCC